MAKYRPIMILGCTSDAGKSFLVAALCRYFSNLGIKVAPFKAQNMSNNAAVTEGKCEIGRAQYFQATAARIVADYRMNPVLLKPSADTMSQVIVKGKYDAAITALPWMQRRNQLWPIVRECLASLIDEYELVIIEGAGSPAEINLRSADIVNLAVAVECHADVYLVSDIDRGGSFAHLFGTWSCFSENEKALVKGFVLNKFRGDPKLLGNASPWLQEKTGVPTVAIVPYARLALPEEDAFFHRHHPATGQATRIALVLYPWASNLEEFDPLFHEAGVEVLPVKENMDLTGFHAILLPGSKSTAASLDYLKTSGLAASISRAAQQGIWIFAVCGGMQLLGHTIKDPHAIEGQSAVGLGLLDIETELSTEKITQQRTLQLPDGQSVTGYEIHMGRTIAGAQAKAHLPENLGFEQGNVIGVYVHGLLENTAYRQRFLQKAGWSGQTMDWQARLDTELDKAAQLIVQSGWAEHLPKPASF